MKTVALLSYTVTSSQRKHNPKSVIDVTLLFEPRRPDLLAVGWGRYKTGHATPRLSLLDVDLLVPCCIQLIALPA